MRMLDAKEIIWNREMVSKSCFQPLQDELTLNNLYSITQTHWREGLESLHYSPSYYYFTARRGGWVFIKENNACVVCWHPNRKGHILVYPPIEMAENELIDSVMQNLPKIQDIVIQIARVPVGLVEQEAVHEPVLDWNCPVRVLSTAKAIEDTGKDLHPVRKEYRKLPIEDLQFKPLSRADIPALRIVGSKYAKRFLKQTPDFALSYNQIIESNTDMLKMCVNRPDLFRSKVSWYQGRPEGLFVWKEVSTRTANALWFLYNREIRGLSYGQMVRACQFLNNQGIEICNFGGSETEGMDFFKTRFRPVQSFKLSSVFITESELNSAKQAA